MEECSWRENSVAMRRHERRGNRPYGFWHWDEGVLDQRKSESYERTFEARFSNSLSQKPLWVDAICISQHNVDERNREVSCMRDIYNSAFCTVAWLGNAASPRQKQYIDTIVDAADELMNFLWLSGAQDVSKWPVINCDLPRLVEITYQLCEAISSRSWFERIWVVQEVVMSKETILMIEDRIMSLNSLCFIAMVFELNQKAGSVESIFNYVSYSIILKTLTLMPRFQSLASHPGGSRPTLDSFADDLNTILNALQSRQATFKHDMIYGLLGLIRLPELPTYLVPDYRVPYETVFWNYSRFIIERTGDLRCLEWKENMVPGVPTWVPDFRLRLRVIEEGGQNSMASISADGRCLTVEGLPFDTCVKTFCHPFCENFIDSHGILSEFSDEILKPLSQMKRLSLDQVVDTWFYTYGTIAVQYDFSIQSLGIFFKLLTHEKTELLFPLVLDYFQSREEGLYLLKMLRTYVWALQGKSFFLTESGYLGVIAATETTVVLNGDVIYWLRGWHLPCILRPLGGGRFMFIKTCIVQFLDPDRFANWWETLPSRHVTLV